MAPPLLTVLLAALLSLLPAAAGGPAAASAAGAPAAPGRSPGGKCLSCHEPHGEPAAKGLPRGAPRPWAGMAGCARCHRGDDRTTRKELAHRGFLPAATARFRLPGDGRTARGRRLLERSGCRRCHVSGGAGVALAADLDRSAATRAPGELSRAVTVPAAAMPDFRFGPEDAAALVNALLANGEPLGGGAEPPRRVHFARPGAEGREGHPFAARCGPCHRALTERFGLLGEGTAGPDLSSLFTPFHPGRGRGGARWDGEAAAAWVRNPRSLRPLALMPPPDAPEGELREALSALRVGAGRLRPLPGPPGTRPSPGAGAPPGR